LLQACVFVGAADVDVVLLAVELPVIVTFKGDAEEAPTEPCRRLTLVEVEVVVEDALATALRVAKMETLPLTLTVVEYDR
jgi:hypothetical protein